MRLARLLAMARAETVAQISYPSRTGKLETRCVSPIGGWLYRGKAYVVGVCHRDIFPKTFAVARISRLEAADELYLQAEDGFDLQAYATRSQFRLEQEIGLRRVTLKVSAEEAWRLKESDPEAVVEEYPDGAVKAEFEVTSPRRFYQYVLGFGRYGSIVSPPELKAGFAAFLRGCL